MNIALYVKTLFLLFDTQVRTKSMRKLPFVLFVLLAPIALRCYSMGQPWSQRSVQADHTPNRPALHAIRVLRENFQYLIPKAVAFVMKVGIVYSHDIFMLLMLGLSLY